jgi:hypothetical protein
VNVGHPTFCRAALRVDLRNVRYATYGALPADFVCTLLVSFDISKHRSIAVTTRAAELLNCNATSALRRVA